MLLRFKKLYNPQLISGVFVCMYTCMRALLRHRALCVEFVESASPSAFRGFILTCHRALYSYSSRCCSSAIPYKHQWLSHHYIAIVYNTLFIYYNFFFE